MTDFFSEPNVHMLVRILVATVLGAVVGIEREYVGKAAGIRTFSLVSLGACLFTVISIFGIEKMVFLEGVPDEFRYNYDPTRIVSQIVVGIGFIGAGLIVFRGFHVEGLTTSAGLWVAAGIGTAAGFGFFLVAAAVAFLTLVIFYLFKRFEPYVEPRGHVGAPKEHHDAFS